MCHQVRTRIFHLLIKINMLHLCMLWELKLGEWNSNNPHGVCPYNDSTLYNLLAKVSNCKTLFWDKNDLDPIRLKEISSVNLDQRPSKNSAILTETNPQLLLGTFWLRQSLLSSGCTEYWGHVLLILSTSWYFLHLLTHNIYYTHLRTIFLTLIYTQQILHWMWLCVCIIAIANVIG